MNNYLAIKEVKKLRYFPLVVLVGLLIFTELLFVLGPVSYSSNNIGLTLLYLILNNISLVLGYNYYCTHLPKSYKIIESRDVDNIRLLKKIIVLTLLLTPIRIKALWDVNSLSIGALVNHFIEAIFKPGDVYSSKLELQSSLVTYLNMFVNVFVILSLSSGVYYYKKLSTKWKYAVILLVVIELSMWIGQGVRKGILDTSLLIFFTTIASTPNIILHSKTLRKYLALSIIGCVVFISFENISVVKC